MKHLITTNENLQYLYSIAADSTVDTIKKLRIAKSILKKLFPVVHNYEMEKKEPVEKIQAINKQIEMIINAGKEKVKEKDIAKMTAEKEKILEEVKPMSSQKKAVSFEKKEIKFLLNELNEWLLGIKKISKASEMDTIDNVYSALECAK